MQHEVMLATKGRLEQPLDSSLRGLGWDLVDKVGQKEAAESRGQQGVGTDVRGCVDLRTCLARRS